MARVPSAFVVRPDRTLLALSLTTMLLFGGGCKHHRSALRPIYAAPAPAVVVPESSCPPGVVEEYGSPYTAPSPLPPSDTSVVPQSGEPVLEPVGPDLNVPSSTRREPRQTVPTQTRRATLRSRVQSFVNDPADLFLPPKADRPWRYVVIHHSAHPTGSYAQIDHDHRESIGTACGYHFVIGNGTESEDGLIEVASRWSEQKSGAHCRDAGQPAVNDYGIGICLIGNLNDAPPTARQIEAARALVDYLSDRYNITTERVGTHAQLAQSTTACPGKHFPAEAILGGRNLARNR